ncbi:hypothetical protein [Geminicoccus harenae]|uniref:hypothetical protein n=1 Tax=Geminicoccus harenae TaxID=2498453 RepID=UPI00168A5B23|nr:hypothetical protein [Geminicoccus harenae]
MAALLAAQLGLILAAVVSLALGVAGGLGRLGMLAGPVPAAGLHGPIMICGFFGTLISLERAVASGAWPALLIPSLSATGAVLLIAGQDEAGAVAFLLAALGLTVLTAASAVRLPAMFTAVMTLGAALWAWGSWQWLAGSSVTEVSYVWLGFLILTIAAERLELSRLARPGAVAHAVLALFLAGFVLALALGQPWTGASAMLSGSLAAIAAWLLRYDIALRTIRGQGTARFAAACLLAGYAWLVAAACCLLLLPPATTVFGHDAAVHAIGTGFVLSMVFAHAPVILPAVTGAPVRYVPALYAPAALLQCAVALRLAADLALAPAWRQGAAILTVTSILLYAGLLLATSFIRPRVRNPA